MASSSSNTSSSSSSSSTARVLPTTAAAPAARAELGVAPSAIASATAPAVAPAAVTSASALNVSRSIGPAPTNFAPAARAPAASTALGGAPGANANASAHGQGVGPPFAAAPGVPPAAEAADSALDVPTDSTTELGVSRPLSKPRSKRRGDPVPVSDIFAHADWSGSGVQAPTSAGVSGSASASDHALVLSDQQQWPSFAPAAVASASALNVTTASTTAIGVSSSIPPTIQSGWGGKPKSVLPPTNYFPAHWSGGRAPDSAGVSQTHNSVAGSRNASRTLTEKSGWPTAADPTTTSTPVMRSTDVGSSSHRPWAWSKPLPYVSTRDPTPTDASPAFATSSSTTPSSDITLVPSAPTSSAPAGETSAHTAQERDASNPSAPDVTKIADHAQPRDASTSSPPPAPEIVDSSLRPNAPAVILSSATGAVMTSTPGAAPTASATSSDPGSGSTFTGNVVTGHGVPNSAESSIPSLRGHWLFQDWGMPPMQPPPPVQPPPGVIQVPSPLCMDCGEEPVTVQSVTCGRFVICYTCYRRRITCPCCSCETWWTR